MKCERYGHCVLGKPGVPQRNICLSPWPKKQKQKPTITTTTTVRPYGGAHIPLEAETGSVTQKKRRTVINPN